MSKITVSCWKSITLAQAHGVEDDKIIKNVDDLDAFMTA
jgi:hypothetical protein